MASTMNRDTLWEEELDSKFSAGVAWMFLLHLNVMDYVKSDTNGYKRLVRYLVEDKLKSHQMIVFYNRSRGITFEKTEMKELFIQLLGLEPLQGQKEVILPKSPEIALPLLERFLKITSARAHEINKKFFKPDAPLGAVIIGFAESLAPNGLMGTQSIDDRTNIITLARWGREDAIQRAGNIIFLMTQNKEEVFSYLRSPNSNIESIKFPFPDYASRLTYIHHLLHSGMKPRMEIEPDKFASFSAGLSLMYIEDLMKRASNNRMVINADYVWDEKKKILEDMSGGLIKVCRPEWDFSVIGGLKEAKAYLNKMADAVMAGDKLRIPMGIIFTGPPGTAKSLLAECFANEIGFAFVILKSLRDPYVGMSERRQEMAYEILEALAPVVVFEDEVEGKNQARGSFYSGDSGVSERMNSRRREFMADTLHRGEIIWLAATNRPDLMDDADLREGRFDAKLPILVPKDPKIKVEIFNAIFRKMSILASRSPGLNFKVEVSEDELIKLIKCSKNLRHSTGAEIETIISHAYKLCKESGDDVVTIEHIKAATEDFISNKDEERYNEMTCLAIKIANFRSLIPEEYRDEADRIIEKKTTRT